MSESQRTCEIDLDAEGRHAGVPRLPHSTHVSACSWIRDAVFQIARDAGPR